jgi:hypothetical protein
VGGGQHLHGLDVQVGLVEAVEQDQPVGPGPTSCPASLVRELKYGLSLTATGTGQGLGNLRERAESLGGRAEIQSAPGEGTRVRVRIPPP